MKILNVALVTLTAISLSACTVLGWMPLGDADPAEILLPGKSTTLLFFTNVANLDSEVGLQASAQYELTITRLSNWMDGSIETNEKNQDLDQYGFADSLMPIAAMALLKRSRDHNWFELMLLQANCKGSSLRGISDLHFDEASGSYNFVATCDGKLSLSVNDSHGFYGNNSGFASISLSRVN